LWPVNRLVEGANQVQCVQLLSHKPVPREKRDLLAVVLATTGVERQRLASLLYRASDAHVTPRHDLGFEVEVCTQMDGLLV